MPAKAKRRKKVPVSQEYLKLSEAAVIMDVTPQTVSRYVREGHKGVYLKLVKVGGAKRTTRKLIDDFVKACSMHTV